MSIRLLALIPVAAAISLALSAAVDAVALPLFLDTTGTILATALAGPGVGIATGVVTVFGCTTTGGIALTTALGKALGLPPLGACFFGSFVSDFGDKAVTFALVTSVLHGLPRRTAARFPWALRAIGAV